MKFKESHRRWIEFYSLLIYLPLLGMFFPSFVPYAYKPMFMGFAESSSDSCIGTDEVKFLLDQGCHEIVICVSKIFSLDGHVLTAFPHSIVSFIISFR